MKRFLMTTAILGVFAITSSGISYGVPYGYLTPTTEGTAHLAPLMQYEFEKEETLNFQNEPQKYKEKRNKKNKYLDYQEGKIDLPQDIRTQYNLQNSGPGTNNLKFIKGDDGQIKIQGY